MDCLLEGKAPFENQFSLPVLSLLSKNINFKIFLIFFTFYITSTFSYYFLNKKFITIQFFFFTFSYKLYQLYITSILIFNHSKKPPRGEEGNGVFKRGRSLSYHKHRCPYALLTIRPRVRYKKPITITIKIKNKPSSSFFFFLRI